MRFISTRRQSRPVRLYEALRRSVAPDGGVYVPDSLPMLPEAFFNNFVEMSAPEIAYVVADMLMGEDVESGKLKSIIYSALNFPVDLVKVATKIYALELFHGPTLAFKDFGARFMAKLIEYSPEFAEGKKLNIIVSTTGNTGSAVANAFAGVSRAEVFVLFPPNPGNRQLERQFTTLGGNIHPVEVQGSVDDCVRLVRQALSDNSLSKDAVLISANSANIVRLLPQTFYYFIGMSRLAASGIDISNVVLSIPCGNLGNLCGAVMANRMGLPMKRTIACENSNSTLSRAFETGRFERRKPNPSLAYAADKGRPSNGERLLHLFDGDIHSASDFITPHFVDDSNIISTINDCYSETGYLLDPHSALAYNGLKNNLSDGETGLLLATAHPAKSPTTMAAITGRALDMPLQLTAFMTGRDHRIRIQPQYSELKSIILASR